MDPHLRGRIDLEKFNKGLEKMENFLPSLQGAASYRPGTKWIGTLPSGNIKLIDFSINNENRYLVVVSTQRIDIYSREGLLLYTRTTDSDNDPIPWLNSELADLRWSREVDKLVFAHRNHQPYVLSANTAFDAEQLLSTEGWTVAQSGDADSISGDYVQNGNHNGQIQFTLSTTHHLRYQGSKVWEIYDISGAQVLFQATTTYEGQVPETGWLAVNGIGSNPTVAGTTASALELYSTEDDTSNLALYAGSSSAQGLTPWTLSKVDFTSHPFLRKDTSNRVMNLVAEGTDKPVEIIRLDSDNPTEFSGLPADLSVSPRYVEYRVNNQWGLGQILDSNTTPAAPADPTDTTIYVQPVDKVVNIKDPSVRLAAIEGSNGTDLEWTVEDGVPNGDTHVRADALVFQTSNIGAWVRIGGNQLFTNVINRDATDQTVNSQDGKVRWCKITDYRGVEDHPVEFLFDKLNNADLESGIVYQVYDWGATITAISVMDGSGLKENEDRSAFVRKDVGTPRFAMNAFAISGGSAGGAATLSEPTGPYASVGMIIANMSTQRQFDVVEVETSSVRVEGTDLIVPTGNITSFDLTNDPDGLASHVGYLQISSDYFESARDTGRYVLGDMFDSQVLFRITEWQSTTRVKVDILSSVPRDTLSGNILNDGVFKDFRMGAWYSGNWPVSVAFYEQRRVFAGSNNDPNYVWLSKLDDDTDFRIYEDDGETLDSSGISYQLGTSSTIIRWLESGPTLVIGTESNEWQLRPNEFNAAITPSNIRITQETPIGSIQQGRRVGSSVFFPHISDRFMVEFKFDFQSQQFVINTVTKLVPTLFESDTVRSFTYQLNPSACFWIVTESGKLKTLTFKQEDDFYAWAEQDIGGQVIDATVLSKGDLITSEDQVWFAVERDGENQLEVLTSVFRDDGSDNYKTEMSFLDSHRRVPSVGYTDTVNPVYSIPNELIVDGKAYIVVDGLDYGWMDVNEDNTVTLPDGVDIEKYIMFGLPYVGLLKGNPITFDGPGKNAYGQQKRVVDMKPYLYKSINYKVGFNTATTQEIEAEGIAPDSTESPSLYTGFVKEHNIIGSQFAVDEVPIIIQDKAYPLTVVSNTMKVEVN